MTSKPLVSQNFGCCNTAVRHFKNDGFRPFLNHPQRSFQSFSGRFSVEQKAKFIYNGSFHSLVPNPRILDEETSNFGSNDPRSGASEWTKPLLAPSLNGFVSNNSETRYESRSRYGLSFAPSLAEMCLISIVNCFCR